MRARTKRRSRAAHLTPAIVAGVLLATAVLIALTASGASAAVMHPAGPAPGGMLGPLTGTDPQGVPLSHYDISGNDENGWNVPASVMLFITNGLFTLARVLVGAQTWMLNWAFSFGAARALLAPAGTIATAYQQRITSGLGLTGTFLTFAAFWCGLMILRGRTAKGAGELAVSVVISALAGTLLASPANALLGDHGLLGQTRDTAMALSSITATGGTSDSQTPGQAAAPLSDTLITTFVTEPYQLLNFGTLMNDPSVPQACRDAYVQIVQQGPWGDAGTPRNMMAAAGCQDLANYDANLTWDRLMGAGLLLVAVLFVTTLVVIITGTLLIAQFSFALYAIACPLVVTIAVLPGGPRLLLWRWAGGIAKVILVILAIAVFIPLFAVFIHALMQGSTGQALAVRFFLIDLAAVAGLIFHRRLIHAGLRAGQHVTGRLAGARIGGARGAVAAAVGGGTPPKMSPVSFSDLHRGARAEISKVTSPARMARQAWTGQRKPPPDGKTGLTAKLATTSGGRTVLRTAKVAKLAGTVAFGSTVGAPVMVPRAAKAASAAARARSTAVRTRLNAVKAKQGRAAGQFGKEWAANTGLAAATRAVKNGPLPAAAIAVAVRTTAAVTPSPRPGYTAEAPLQRSAASSSAPQDQAGSPAALPKLTPMPSGTDHARELRDRLAALAKATEPGTDKPATPPRAAKTAARDRRPRRL